MSSVANQSSRQACGVTVLRVVVGIVFLAHGWQKLFGFGFHGVAGFFAGAGIPLPFVSGVIVTLVEFLGGIALVLGLLTRWAAALNAFDMLVAILVVHMKNGFFDQNHGVEFPLTLLAACVALTMLGPGSLSVDGALSKRE